jgi:hypothetical protein
MLVTYFTWDVSGLRGYNNLAISYRDASTGIFHFHHTFFMWRHVAAVSPIHIYWDVTATLDPVGRTEGRHPHDSAKAQHLDRIVQSHVGCLFLLVLQSAGRLLAFFGSSQQCYSHACLHNATSVYYFDSYFVRLLATVACHTSYFFAIPTDVIKF